MSKFRTFRKHFEKRKKILQNLGLTKAKSNTKLLKNCTKFSEKCFSHAKIRGIRGNFDVVEGHQGLGNCKYCCI